MTKIENKNSLLSLLNILNEKNSQKPTKIDFLLSLLKEIKDKRLIKELIINSNFDKNTKEKLLKFFNLHLTDIKNTNTKINSKFIDIKNKKTSKNILNNIETKEILKNNLKEKPSIIKVSTNDKDNIKPEDIIMQNESLLEKLLLQTSVSENLINKIETEIKTKPKNIQKEIVKEIKTLIIMKKNNPIIKKIIISKEFKEASSFKDILNISKKYNLNILKIAIKTIKQTIENQNIKKFQTDHFIFEYKIQKNFIKKQINKNKPIVINNKIQNQKEINLQNLLIHNTKDKKFNNSNLSQTIKNTRKNKKDDQNIIPSISINQNIKHKIIKAKQTIKHFTSSLKEAIENYKPPITKLSLELHPKEIGKVEVIIKQRGDNLQIQLNTNNQNTVNFFIQNQNELKNSLVNMGFTNINMNFNSNDQNKKQNQQKNQFTSKIENEENEELIIDFSYKYA